ncbi:MAG: SUMF1/EgtB/PvdO family nonheme iron enzyme [Pseudomonadota bacterium]|nr:SUMF1/EgtB/PvdO family nonheme iron enzyme [Pseudomonadota bacterium]
MTAVLDPALRALLPLLAVDGAPPAAERWEAEHPTFGGRVAFEVAGPDEEAWFASTRALARLQHPAIPPLHEVGLLPDGRLARVRTVVTGVAWREAAPMLGERPRADALIRAAEALAYAHARGIAHGRFGEGALVLGESGQVWVIGWEAADGAFAPAADLTALLTLIDAWVGLAVLGEADAGGTLRTAAAIAASLRGWLDGADRRARALGLVARAEALRAAGAEATRASKDAARVARLAVAAAPTWEPESTRHPAWALEDAAEELRRTAVDCSAAARRALHAALEQDAALPEAHVAQARAWSRAAAEAQLSGAAAAEARAELAVGEHVRRLLPSHPLRAGGDRVLRGTGALTLVTDPPGAHVTVERYVEVDHRLVLRPEGTLGHSPLNAVDLAPGSYRLRLDAPGCAPAFYPVHLTREAHWDGRGPGEAAPHPIRLLPPDALGPDDCYVPAGWFWSGSRTASVLPLPPRRLWCDAFVIRRFPVTADALTRWLDALLDAGAEERALELAPRLNWYANEARLHYPRGEGGRFRPALPPAREDWPALYVPFPTAVAYANALRAEDGRPWRLPMELEWEKAARGVDGRPAPWGRRTQGRWGNRGGPDGPGTPVSVHTFPLDESPYGVRGVAANSLDWCADPFAPLGPELPDARVAVLDPTPDRGGVLFGVARGGSFNSQTPHLANRETPFAQEALPSLGFRLARSLG